MARGRAGRRGCGSARDGSWPLLCHLAVQAALEVAEGLLRGLVAVGDEVAGVRQLGLVEVGDRRVGKGARAGTGGQLQEDGVALSRAGAPGEARLVKHVAPVREI